MIRRNTPQMYVCIVGCGDVGQRLAVSCITEGAELVAVARSNDSLLKLKSQGLTTWQCDLDDSAMVLPSLPPGNLVYYFVPPPAQGLQDTHCQRFLTLLDQQQHRPSRIIAISTTSVYGNRHGELVTEDDAPNPQVDRAQRRYDMECQLQNWCKQNRVALIILRVGGIYGPGRLPLARIKKQIPVLHEALAPQTNRIHVDDLVAVCKAAAMVAQDFRIYNVSDGQDSNMTEYFYTLADYFHLPRPPSVDWEMAEQTMSEGMLSYLRESRRIDNSRMLKELNIRLLYPNLSAGLRSCDSED